MSFWGNLSSTVGTVWKGICRLTANQCPKCSISDVDLPESEQIDVLLIRQEKRTRKSARVFIPKGGRPVVASIPQSYWKIAERLTCPRCKHSWETSRESETKSSAVPEVSPANFTFDPDITELLKGCSNADLAPLVSFLVPTSLTSTARHKKHQPNHILYVHEIVDVIQTYGNDAADHRGCYRAVVRYIYDTLGITGATTDSVEEMETRILSHVLDKCPKSTNADATIDLQERIRKGAEQCGSWKMTFSAASCRAMIPSCCWIAMLRQENKFKCLNQTR